MIRLKVKAVAVDGKDNEQEVDLWLEPTSQYRDGNQVGLWIEVDSTTLGRCQITAQPPFDPRS